MQVHRKYYLPICSHFDGLKEICASKTILDYLKKNSKFLFFLTSHNFSQDNDFCIFNSSSLNAFNILSENVQIFYSLFA